MATPKFISNWTDVIGVSKIIMDRVPHRIDVIDYSQAIITPTDNIDMFVEMLEEIRQTHGNEISSGLGYIFYTNWLEIERE